MHRLNFDGIAISWESLRPELLRALSALPMRTSVARQALAREWARPDFYERWDEQADFFDRRRAIFGSLGADAQQLLEQLLADVGFGRSMLQRSDAEETIRVALIELKARRNPVASFYDPEGVGGILKLMDAPPCQACAGLGRVVEDDEAAKPASSQARAY